MDFLRKITGKITSPESVNTVRTTFPDPAVNVNSTEFEVNNWVISEFILSNLVPVVGHHPYPLTELTLIVGAYTYFKPKYVFEWGTHVGKAARIFFEASKAFQIDTEIHTIDLPDDVDHVEHPHESRGMLVKDFKEVTQHLGDGLDTALKLYKEIAKGAPSLFFVDGDHSYESVKREVSAIIKEVENPIILAHDTFYQSEDSKYNIGPFKAISEVVGSNKSFRTLSTNTGLPGMTLIFKK
jgi:hypothetical protein